MIFFYSVVPTSVKQQILDILSFKESTLPVKYLSLPLIPEKLSSKDCKLLLEKLASIESILGLLKSSVL